MGMTNWIAAQGGRLGHLLNTTTQTVVHSNVNVARGAGLLGAAGAHVAGGVTQAAAQPVLGFGREFIKNIKTSTKVALGVGAAGTATLIGGSMVMANARDSSAKKLGAEAELSKSTTVANPDFAAAADFGPQATSQTLMGLPLEIGGPMVQKYRPGATAGAAPSMAANFSQPTPTMAENVANLGETAMSH